MDTVVGFLYRSDGLTADCKDTAAQISVNISVLQTADGKSWTIGKKLQSGLKEMGLDLSGEQQDKLLAYVEMLKKWNKTYNLTALRDESQIISHHLLDSLTLPPYLEGAQTMLDVGSGGGQPGIPAAVCRPDLQITLLDANTKKLRFCNRPRLNWN